MSAGTGMLHHPVRVRVVARYIGQLGLMLSVMVAIPAAVAAREGHYELAVRYLSVIALLVSTGVVTGRIRAPQRIQLNEAMVIATAMFVISPLLMSFPLMGVGITFVDALFEAVSGITTTGLSTLPTVEDKPTPFLFARAWMQWYGGLGIVVLALAIVTRPGALARRLAMAEGYEHDVVGNTRTHARRLVLVYCVLTALGIVGLWLLGAGWFDSLVYTLAAVSTGGFAPHDASLAAFDAASVQYGVIALCVLGSIPLFAYHRASHDGWKVLARDAQVRALVAAGLIMIVLMSMTLFLLSDMQLLAALRNGPIMALSAQSTAGFASVSAHDMDGASKLLMIFMMTIGGGAGSTAGGVKLLRIIVLLSVVRSIFVRTTLPKHAVYQPRISGHRIEREEVSEAMTIVALFMLTVVFSWLAFVAWGYPAMDSLFEVTSATGTVGLSAGITSPDLPSGLKMVLCVDMLLGRLEFIALLVLIYPRTWIPRRRHRS